MKRFSATALVIILATALLGGCSGTRLYKADLPHNLQVNSNIKSASAALHIYRVDKQCRTTYQGTVELDSNIIELGIPEGAPSYLVVSFASSSFWANSQSRMSHDTRLSVRKGYRYRLDVSYIDDIYNLSLHEISLRTGSKRELDTAAQGDCAVK